MVLLFASCGHLSFLLFCFEFVFFCFFHIPLKKDPPKNRTQQKPEKAKMQKITDKSKNQFEQLCSQIVFFNFLGASLKISFLLKTL